MQFPLATSVWNQKFHSAIKCERQMFRSYHGNEIPTLTIVSAAWIMLSTIRGGVSHNIIQTTYPRDTSRTVPGSIPGGVTGFFSEIFLPNLPCPGIDLSPSENEYQKYFLGVKAAGAWGWRPHHFHVPNVMKIWEPKPPGTLWATPGLLREYFTFTYTRIKIVFTNWCTSELS